jgi:ATP-dependent exoDNAse (exonuclease V) beta subunit
VLYVAMTRAEERMYVLTGSPAKDASSLGTVSDMFAYFYQRNGEWSQENVLYTFGEGKQHVASKHSVALQGYSLKSFNSNLWRESIKMRAAAPGIWNTQMAEVKKDYGVMVHSALARIRVSSDVENALNSMLAEGMIDLEEKNVLDAALVRLLANPELQPHFREGLVIKNEAEIILKEAKMFRPDRVVINGKEAVIIDYKTGKEKQEHKAQIMEYGDRLKEMGYVVNELLLVYLETDKGVDKMSLVIGHLAMVICH